MILKPEVLSLLDVHQTRLGSCSKTPRPGSQHISIETLESKIFILFNVPQVRVENH